MNLIILLILLFAYLGFLINLLKGFKRKQIAYLIIWGWLLYIFLQFFYFLFDRWFNIDLFFVKWKLEINNFITRTKDYVDVVWKWQYWIGSISLFLSLIVAASVEEIGKFLIFKKINSKLDIIKSINTSIFWITYVAIWFAIFETAWYLTFFSASEKFNGLVKILITRWVISTASHVLFSVIVWYYYGKALFLKFQIIDNLEISKTTALIKKLKKIPLININTISKYYYIKYMLTWFTLSIIIHSVYNYFMETSKNEPSNVIFAIITVIIWMLIFFKIINTKKHNNNYYEIKNKINYLKEMKDLKTRVYENKKEILFNSKNTLSSLQKNTHLDILSETSNKQEILTESNINIKESSDILPKLEIKSSNEVKNQPKIDILSTVQNETKNNNGSERSW